MFFKGFYLYLALSQMFFYSLALRKKSKYTESRIYCPKYKKINNLNKLNNLISKCKYIYIFFFLIGFQTQCPFFMRMIITEFKLVFL